MPIQQRSDAQGSFYRWGNSGKKYYYIVNNKRSRDIAKQKAKRQGMAIIISRNIN